MEKVTFETLPEAVVQVMEKLDSIQRMLAERKTNTEPGNEAWLNLAELCLYLPDKPVRATVYGWVHHRKIPCHRRGKKLYFLKSEIDIWLKGGRRKTIAETASEVDNYLHNNKKG